MKLVIGSFRCNRNPKMTTQAPRFGFGFEARVGKDTAVEYLIKKHGGVRISFASPIYDILEYAQNVCGFEKVKDREFLQQIRTFG
jgi:hypothetical protein